MRRRTLPGIPPRLMLAVTAALSVAVTVLVVLSPPGVPADGETRDGRAVTRWGPLTDADRQLLTAVRRAGLWEIPAGQQAQQRASSTRVKEVGDAIMRQHMELDEDARRTADRLGVILPSEPNADQKAWLAEMSRTFGADYDRVFVLRLRAAHGKVYAVIARTRAQTENTEVRAFADRSMRFVNNHMRLLESTGLVTPSALH
ncbi:DUF4142 domain-containing protein [Actinomadura flavalba]|uniref:DUF4142 domain-containing protein n=1 Tax=Actinomadura flavalba TaxID=1120938 RepID=UPI000363ACDF|nr:DUF4142 domain-containing protein [Actinomadura flavalba]